MNTTRCFAPPVSGQEAVDIHQAMDVSRPIEGGITFVDVPLPFGEAFLVGVPVRISRFPQGSYPTKLENMTPKEVTTVGRPTDKVKKNPGIAKGSSVPGFIGSPVRHLEWLMPGDKLVVWTEGSVYLVKVIG